MDELYISPTSHMIAPPQPEQTRATLHPHPTKDDKRGASDVHTALGMSRPRAGDGTSAVAGCGGGGGIFGKGGSLSFPHQRNEEEQHVEKANADGCRGPPHAFHAGIHLRQWETKSLTEGRRGVGGGRNGATGTRRPRVSTAVTTAEPPIPFSMHTGPQSTPNHMCPRENTT